MAIETWMLFDVDVDVTIYRENANQGGGGIK